MKEKPYFYGCGNRRSTRKGSRLKACLMKKYLTAQENLQMPEEKLRKCCGAETVAILVAPVGLETAAFLAQRLPEGAAEFGIKIIEQKEKMEHGHGLQWRARR